MGKTINDQVADLSRLRGSTSAPKCPADRAAERWLAERERLIAALPDAKQPVRHLLQSSDLIPANLKETVEALSAVSFESKQEQVRWATDLARALSPDPPDREKINAVFIPSIFSILARHAAKSSLPSFQALSSAGRVLEMGQELNDYTRTLLADLSQRLWLDDSRGNAPLIAALNAGKQLAREQEIAGIKQALEAEQKGYSGLGAEIAEALVLSLPSSSEK